MAGKNFDISRFAGTIAPVRSESDTMREIAIDKILDNPRNFYPKPDTKALAALEDSIRANGLLEPPTVIAAEDGTSYRLDAGAVGDGALPGAARHVGGGGGIGGH